MGDGATLEDVVASRDEEPLQQKEYLKAISGDISQLGSNPLSKIDFAKAEAMNNATWAEKKPKGKKEYVLKRLFLQYAKKYALKWNAVLNYPKQIKQKPAWFDLALSMFKENEISSTDKKTITTAFNMLWEYRDKMEPESVMAEEESLRQYGVNSPYYQMESTEGFGEVQSSPEIITPTEGILESSPEQAFVQPPTVIEPQPQQAGSNFGVRKVPVQSEEDFLTGMGGFKSNIVNLTPLSRNRGLPKPQGAFDVGLTPTIKRSAVGGGAFDIGRGLFSQYSYGAIQKPRMNLPSQPVQVKPAETITVSPQPQVVQRKRHKSKSLVNRASSKVSKMSSSLAKFRMIELPTIPKQKVSLSKPKSSIKIMPKKNIKGKKIRELADMNVAFNNAKSAGKIKISGKVGKGTIEKMSKDIKSSVTGVVGGIKNLKKQVRSEFKTNKSLRDLNLKNIKSNKVKTNRNLNVLNKLKSEAHMQMSREALECKMIPKLRDQCDRVFKNNHVTNEVVNFRNEFKDISKAVPTVRGEKARLVEVGIVGGSINHGVEGAHVNDVRRMYRDSGSTKQMNIGMVEYDYSFATGKKQKIKTPPIVEEYYEEVVQ